MTKAVKLTPMLQQYLEIKEQHEDAILFYRMGDFYEMFFEDAQIAAKILGITLTARNKKDEKNKVPMCGVPYHAAQGYIAKLVQAGKRVAICEQTEDPSQAKGIVRRDVVRIVSPGVVTDSELLDDRSNNYVAALTREDTGKNTLYGLSLLDVSTGTFLAGEFSCKAGQYDEVIDQLTRLQPSEIIINSADELLHKPLLSHLEALLPGVCITRRESSFFHFKSCYETLLEHFSILTLEGFGFKKNNLGVVSAGVLLQYSFETQKSSLDHINSLATIELDDFLLIDDSSRRNLELTQTIIGGKRQGSLLSVLDVCATPMGSRLLKNRLLFPLRSVERINGRLDAVNFFFHNSQQRRELRNLLDTVYDIERLNSRNVLGTANGRDMIAMKQSLAQLPKIYQLLTQTDTEKLLTLRDNFDTLDDIFALLERSIAPEPPVTVKEGNIIKEGYNQELDELLHILRNGKQLILELENQERQKTGIAKLKVAFNKVFGYFIEISKVHLDKVPEHYIRKQTLVNAERFITPELKEFEAKVLGAEEKRLELEYQLFREIRQTLADASNRLLLVADTLAQLDVFSSLAESAIGNNYRRPVLSESEEIHITEGRHPVIEQALGSGKFVPNDVFLDQKSNEVLIITGPNMAGKSTVLRQTAIIVLMAQLGSFVPAESAEIGLVDRIFTRVGAMDDLRRGQSTFMVEMSETANILNNVTDKSLVILDEIGRGTSTFDGLSIAWAVAEELVTRFDKGVKTLFATHYHELTELATIQPRVQNYSIAVREWNDTIIFLHKLVKGGANRSYGIQVAALAGVPQHVVQRAQQILRSIEKGDFLQANHDFPAPHNGQDLDASQPPSQLSLFAPSEKSIESLLLGTDVDGLSPREALELVYEIKSLLEKASE